jgi:hypothetical protein
MQRTLVVLALLVVVASARAHSQQTVCPMKMDSTGGLGGMGMMMDHAMMARMDTVDARLDSLAKVMSRATGTRKVDAMSALLSALVAQRLDMRRMMHEHMMGQMGMPEMRGMGGASGMMPMDGANCPPAARPDSARSHDPTHDH